MASSSLLPELIRGSKDFSSVPGPRRTDGIPVRLKIVKGDSCSGGRCAELEDLHGEASDLLVEGIAKDSSGLLGTEIPQTPMREIDPCSSVQLAVAMVEESNAQCRKALVFKRPADAPGS